MAEENRDESRETNESQSASGDSALMDCADVEVNFTDSKVTITTDSEEEFVIEITVRGKGCRSIHVCRWNGREWVCTRK